METKIRFQKFAVVSGTTKARAWYSLDNRSDKRKCVTIYAKDYSDDLATIFHGDPSANYKNDTDIQTDYFDKGHVVLFEGHPLYAPARARAEMIKAEREARILVTHGMTCNCSECTAIRRAGKPASALAGLRAKFAARPDVELSLPVRAERNLDCLECLTQRRCFTHAPAVPRGGLNDSEYGQIVASLEGSCRG